MSRTPYAFGPARPEPPPSEGAPTHRDKGTIMKFIGLNRLAGLFAGALLLGAPIALPALAQTAAPPAAPPAAAAPEATAAAPAAAAPDATAAAPAAAAPA